MQLWIRHIQRVCTASAVLFAGRRRGQRDTDRRVRDYRRRQSVELEQRECGNFDIATRKCTLQNYYVFLLIQALRAVPFHTQKPLFEGTRTCEFSTTLVAVTILNYIFLPFVVFRVRFCGSFVVFDFIPITLSFLQLFGWWFLHSNRCRCCFFPLHSTVQFVSMLSAQWSRPTTTLFFHCFHCWTTDDSISTKTPAAAAAAVIWTQLWMHWLAYGIWKKQNQNQHYSQRNRRVSERVS